MNAIKSAWRKVAGFVKQIHYLHIDIPSTVILAVIILVLWQPLANFLFELIGLASQELTVPDWFRNAVPNVLANLISAAIIVLFVFGLIRIQRKSYAAGRFKAYNLLGAKREYWGEIRLSYNLFSNKMKGVLQHGDLVLSMDGRLEMGQYLRGHYIEKSNLARRRTGAFLLRLDGSTDAYRGAFVAVDPTEGGDEPHTGEAVWERIK